MKLLLLSLATLLLATPSLADLCLGSCEVISGEKVCNFELKVDLYASEYGHWTVEGCEGVMPTLGIEKGVTKIFDRSDETNYFHPLGFAYMPHGEGGHGGHGGGGHGGHGEGGKLGPMTTPPGSVSMCSMGKTCPAPMYTKDGNYLGMMYSNNEYIASPLMGGHNFGLHDYESNFSCDFLTWKTAGKYEVALKFDVEDFTQDIFYFCHIHHKFMIGRIKFVDEKGDVLQEMIHPMNHPYNPELPTGFDESWLLSRDGQF